jgi:hypothetical protein
VGSDGLRPQPKAAEEKDLRPPFLVEAKDADGDCVARVVFALGADQKLYPASDSTPRDAEEMLAVCPLVVVLTDAEGKRLEMKISAPEPHNRGELTPRGPQREIQNRPLRPHHRGR